MGSSICRWAESEDAVGSEGGTGGHGGTIHHRGTTRRRRNARSRARPDFDGDLEGCGPSQPPVDRCQNRFTATTERSPPGNRLAMAAGRGNADRWRAGGLRSLAAAGGPMPVPFHGYDGA
jgi:hypothetical protein